MADKSVAPTSVNLDSMEEALHRLSKKPGVKAWLMMDRVDGAVLKTNGQVAAVRPAKESSETDAANNSGIPPSVPTPTSPSFAADVQTDTNNETVAAQELAAIVWSFMSSAGSLVDEMDTEDELKLLRLRTKKQEFVIVPEQKYLLVVVHDTPLV